MHETACKYARTGTEESFEKAVEASLPLCAVIAKRFSRRGEYDDLYQTASLALCSALKRFDLSAGVRFTTYATPYITGSVKNYLRDKTAGVHVPRLLIEKGNTLLKKHDELLNTMRREPTPNELAQALAWSLDSVMEVMNAQGSLLTASLEAENEDGLTLADLLSTTENGYNRFEDKDAYDRALKILSPDERQLIRLRFEDGLSQRNTAEKMNCTQMQISRMERRILNTLRQYIEN